MNDQPHVGIIQSRYQLTADRSVLIALEPRVTAPRMYMRRVLRQYGHRFAASPIWAERMRASSFRWPQEISPQVAPPSEYRFMASMVNGDKRSAMPGSLYGLRRAVIHESSMRGMPLAVFGSGWDASARQRAGSATKVTARALACGTVPRLEEAFSDLNQHPEFWMGTVESKEEAFASAPVSIIIENSADYVSEKLVDAVRGGTVPVYVGPPLSRFGLPESIALMARPSAEGVVRAAMAVSPQRAQEVVSAGKTWLASSEAQVHDIRTVLFELGERISRQVRARVDAS